MAKALALKIFFSDIFLSFFPRKQLGLVHWFYLPLLVETAFCCTVVAPACVQRI